jgi:predicted NBD/HSP70 family sugar kinase
MSEVARMLEPINVMARDPVRFGSGAGLVLAFEVGFEDLRCGLVDANGRCVCDMPADPDPAQLVHPPHFLLDRMHRLAVQVLERAFDEQRLTDDDGALALLGATVAWPFAVGRDGVAHGHTFLNREWRTMRLARRVSAMLRGPFENTERVDGLNAAHAAVVALAFDLTRGRTGEPPGQHSSIIMAIRLQGGIGAGTMKVAKHHPRNPDNAPTRLAFVESSLIVGTAGFAGEVAHLPISDSMIDSINADRPDGLAPMSRSECSCGQSDHLEGVASARALMHRLIASGYKLDLSQANAPQVTALLEHPDEVVARALHDIGRLVGRALASPILMLDPARITLTGYLARDSVVDGIVREQHSWSTSVSSSVKVQAIPGGPNAPVELRGAALAMFRRRLYHDLSQLASETGREKLFVRFSRHDLNLLRLQDERSAHVGAPNAY